MDQGKKIGPAQQRLRNEKWLAKKTDKLVRKVLKAVKDDVTLKPYNVQVVEGSGCLIIKETKGLRIFWVASSGYIEASTIHADAFEIPHLQHVGFHVSELEHKFPDGETWKNLETSAIDGFIKEIHERIQKLLQSAVGLPPETLRFAIWPDLVWASSYFEPDNPYFHVMMSFPVGGVVTGDSEGVLTAEVI